MELGVVDRRRGGRSVVRCTAGLLTSAVVAAVFVAGGIGRPIGSSRAGARDEPVTAGAPSRVSASTSSDIVVSLRGLIPTVARAGAPVQVRGDVTNRVSTAVDGL